MGHFKCFYMHSIEKKILPECVTVFVIHYLSVYIYTAIYIYST